MRLSCNGCRVLRKGCSADCSIRPCLQWIKSSQAQGNATVFLAKFYGRAGLMNLIDAGPEHLRPAIFRSLLYEACGRMVNPIYGSTGLLWSGSWHLCQAAVEAVLTGVPIAQVPAETAETAPVPPLLKASSYDIRHVAKEDSAGVAAGTARVLHKADGVTRPRAKRSPNHYSSTPGAGVEPAEAKRQCCAEGFHDAPRSRLSSGSGASEPSSASGVAVPCTGNGRDNETAVVSQETAEASMLTSHDSAETAKAGCHDADDSEVELELTLGFKPLHHRHNPHSFSSSSRRRHSRAHSPTLSSAGSVAAEVPKKCDGQRRDSLGGDVSAVDLRL